MRNAICFFAFALALAAAAQAYTVEARGERYSVAIQEPHLTPVKAECDVRVTDLSTNAVIWTPHLVWEGDAGDVIRRLTETMEKDGLKYEIKVELYDNAMASALIISRDGAMVDSLVSAWSGPSHQLGINVSGSHFVGKDVKAPRVVNHVAPQYPGAARMRGIKGVVMLTTFIDKSGTLRQAVVLRDLGYGTSDAALEAVKQWRFEPATLNGQPVDVVLSLAINFKLN